MPNNTAFPITWISALFKKFQGIYGHKFTSSIDGIEEIAAREWSRGLAGLTGDQIAVGLEKCAMRKLTPGEEDWPPTPGEFRALCLPECVPMIHRRYPVLGKLWDAEKGRAAIAEARKLLRGGKCES